MKKKTLYSIEDLISFCGSQNFTYFNSKDAGYALSVLSPAMFEEENTDDNHRGMMKLKIKLFHTGLNRNGSYVTESAAKEAMKTIPDRPLLAAIHQLDDGTYDFEGHEMEYIENEDGKEELVYIERQVGSFSSEAPFWEHDDENDKDFVCAYAYVSEEYTKTCDIIRRKNGTKNSCELFIDEFAYNAKEKYLDLKHFYVNGSTLLGSRADGTEIGEGMQGSRADIADFSVNNNSSSHLNNKSSMEINSVDDNKILEKGGKQPMENLEKDELEIKDEVFEEEEVASASLEEETNASESEKVVLEAEQVEEAVVEMEENPEEAPEETSEEFEAEAEVDRTATYTVTINGETKTFSLSLNDIMYSLCQLVNETYACDETYYSVDVYAEDKYVVMVDMWTGKAYKQSYKTKKDSFSLSGDRVPVRAIYVTDDEERALDEMRSKYSEYEVRIAEYEQDENQRNIANLFASNDYVVIANNEKFVELKESFESGDKLLYADVKQQADNILLEAVKSGNIENFSDQKKVGCVTLPVGKKPSKKKNSRFGDLFDGILN